MREYSCEKRTHSSNAILNIPFWFWKKRDRKSTEHNNTQYFRTASINFDRIEEFHFVFWDAENEIDMTPERLNAISSIHRDHTRFSIHSMHLIK